jgi:hypothetical protein
VDEDEVEVESFDEEMVSFLFENDEEMGSMPCRGVYLKQKKMNRACVRFEPGAPRAGKVFLTTSFFFDGPGGSNRGALNRSFCRPSEPAEF